MRRRLLAVLLAAAVACILPAPALAAGDPIQELEELIRSGLADPPPEALSEDDWALLGDLFGVPTREDVELELALLDPAGAMSEQAALAEYIRRTAAWVAAYPGDAVEITKLALAYQMQGNWSQARTYLLKALRLEPESETLHRYLAEVLAQAEPGIHVLVSGVPVVFDVRPIIQNGRTLVPIRYVIERLGGQAGYDGATRTVTVTLGARRLELVVGNATARVNGRPIQLDVPATIIGGRTLVPLRFVSENLGARVGYYPAGGGNAVIAITP